MEITMMLTLAEKIQASKRMLSESKRLHRGKKAQI
jgi:hypothetical protein